MTDWADNDNPLRGGRGCLIAFALSALFTFSLIAAGILLLF